MITSQRMISTMSRKAKSFCQPLQRSNCAHLSTAASEGRKKYSDIPGPRRLPLIGNVHLFGKFGPYSFEKLYDAYTDFHQCYGPVVRLEMGIPLVLLFDPQDVSTLLSLGEKFPERPLFKALRHYRLVERRYSCGGLVSENGEQWKRLRNAVAFMTASPYAGTYFKSHEKVADDFISRIRAIKDENGRIPNFLPEIFRFTQEAIGVVCFGVRLGVLESSNSGLSKEITAASHDLLEALADTLLQPEYCWKLFKTPVYKKLVKSHDFFHNLASDCVKKAEVKLNDPLYKDDPNLDFIRTLLNDKNLTSSDVILLMVEIFSAGLDTTGSSIGFLLYNLARNPEVQEKLHGEILEHSKNGIDGESLENMKYLTACMKESFRLNPSTGGTARILPRPTVFSGYEVPSGVTCLGLHPVICRLEKHFEEPLQFRPERWTVKREGRARPASMGHPYCLIPFSHGVRNCVGRRFGEQEIKLGVLKVIEKFRVEYDGPDVGTMMRLSLIPDKPLNFKFIER